MQDMKRKPVVYCRTSEPLMLGDRIKVRQGLIFKRSVSATVVYVPGQNMPDSDLTDKEFAYRLDRDGGIYVGAYLPGKHGTVSKQIQLIRRADASELAVLQSFQMPSQAEFE